MASDSMAKKGFYLVFVAALLLSIGGLCIKMIPWQPLSINSFRSIIALAILIPFAKITRVPFRLTPGVLAGAGAVWGATTLYTVATKLTTAGNAVLLQFTAPMFVILFMWLVFRERPRRLDIVACLCIFGGVVCFFLDSLGSGRFVGDVIAVLSGICYAWVFMMQRLPGGSPLWSTILGQALGAVVGLPSLVQETQFDGTSLLFGALLGVFQLGLAYAFLTTGLKYAKPITASLVTGIEPVLNPILVALVVGETLSPLALVGGAVVFLSVMIYNLLCLRLEQREKAAPTSTK
ncbi:MAG TPA: DMT family transporter [Candidatus Evtepia faecigallinarum]|nr:DMT family transporter [Candidatus Evtepia faecigallinarum]